MTHAQRFCPVWCFAALIGYAVFLFVPQVLNDGDTYFHIAAGQWILDHGVIPRTDPFSYTFAGAPWVAHEWLAEIIMALAYRLGSWNGVVILFGLSTALTLGMLERYLTRWLTPLSATITLILAAACLSGSLLARPHMLALPLLEIWTAGLLIARERGQAPSFFLLPVMLLWANLHGGFIFGLALIGPFALEAMIAAKTQWPQALCRWGIFGTAAVATAIVTPQGWHGLLFPLQLMDIKQLHAMVEWQPTNFLKLQPIDLALIALLYIGFTRGIRLPAIRLLVLTGVLYLALQYVRCQMLASIVGALMLAQPLVIALGATSTKIQKAKYELPIMGGFVVLVAMLTVISLTHPIVRTDGPTSPVSAFAHVPEDLAAMPVLNDQAFGAYLIFKGVRPFIDGRIDMYGDAFMTEYLEMMRPDRKRLEQTLKTRDIRWVMIAADAPATAVMDRLEGWHRLYGDTTAVVYVRSTAK